MSKIENKLFERYCLCWKELDSLWDDTAEKLGLSPTAMMVVMGVAIKEPITQKELCEMWAVNKQTLNSAVKKLIQEEYISLRPSNENFREKLLYFTEKGKALSEKTAVKMGTAEITAFNRLTSEEQKSLVFLMEKCIGFEKEEFKKITGGEK